MRWHAPAHRAGHRRQALGRQLRGQPPRPSDPAAGLGFYLLAGGMPATRRARREATNLLTAIPEEVALRIACALASLASPIDLLHLALACPRRYYTVKCIATSLSRAGASSATGATGVEMWSIVEEAARRWLVKCSEQERGWGRRCRTIGQPQLGMMSDVVLLRLPLVFEPLSLGHEENFSDEVVLLEDGALATGAGELGEQSALKSPNVMCAGRHFAQFTLVNLKDSAFLGVSDELHVHGGTDGSTTTFYAPTQGSSFPGGKDWTGMQTAEEGDRIGLLLDIDQGSLTVYKNDTRLGTVVGSRLRGCYKWAVGVESGESVRIEHAALPPA